MGRPARTGRRRRTRGRAPGRLPHLRGGHGCSRAAEGVRGPPELPAPRRPAARAPSRTGPVLRRRERGRVRGARVRGRGRRAAAARR
ncbi:hypothetical protein D0T12_29360 [Actinomadura spongiicola]|uniref:Uncharacterized protein n=1 Tax=Actinomadura spongiicola TaxID=2303421 RepID=A0A372G9L7_9ACTN|nr:hypothetical protein D0T12_29360 [Actinomadura spongiicola]